MMSTSSGILMRGDFRKRDGSTLKAPGIASGPSVPASSSKSNRSSTATLFVDFSLIASIAGLMRRSRSLRTIRHRVNPRQPA